MVSYVFRVVPNPGVPGRLRVIALTPGGDYWVDRDGCRLAEERTERGAGVMYKFTDRPRTGRRRGRGHPTAGPVTIRRRDWHWPRTGMQILPGCGRRCCPPASGYSDATSDSRTSCT